MKPWPKFNVLGVEVAALQIPDAVFQMQDWIKKRAAPHFIAATSVHGIMEAQRNPYFKKILSSAGLVVPDGMPLVWAGRRQGYILKRRVYGPELMETFCRQTGRRYRNFFYGGKEETTKRLADILQQRYGLTVAGSFSPPFRPLTVQEDAQIINIINQARPDVLWVGLSTPKQEIWMYEHSDRLNVPVMAGVGAAFDFIAGFKPQAPSWMQERGLEWFFRLITEPGRLWHRHLVLGPKFFCYLLLERLTLKKF